MTCVLNSTLLGPWGSGVYAWPCTQWNSVETWTFVGGLNISMPWPNGGTLVWDDAKFVGGATPYHLQGSWNSSIFGFSLSALRREFSFAEVKMGPARSGPFSVTTGWNVPDVSRCRVGR